MYPEIGYPDEPGVFELSFSNNEGADYSEDQLSFSFVRTPEVHSVSPDKGSPKGNLTVTIKGNYFLPPGHESYAQSNAKCYFGDNSSPATIVDGSTIRCSVPVGSGRVPVMVPFPLISSLPSHFFPL